MGVVKGEFAEPAQIADGDGGALPGAARLARLLHDSEARFRALTTLSTDGYWEQDEAYRLTSLTGGNLELAGIDLQQLIGRAPWDCGAVPVGDGGNWARHKAALQARQAFADFVCRFVNSRGEPRYISCSGKPKFDAKGRFKGYRGVAKDITESKRAEELLRLEHSVSRSIVEADNAAAALRAAIRAVCETENWECGRYFHWDEKAGLLRYGESWGVEEPAIQGFLARSRGIVYQPGVGLAGTAWLSGQPLWVADITQDSRARRSAFADDVDIRGGFVFPIVSEGRPIGTLAFNSREVREPEDRLIRAIGVIGAQIGQLVHRKQAQEVLRESEEHFRAVVDSANEGILVYDRSLRVIAGNAAAERIIGLPLAELSGAAGFTSLLPCIREDGSPLLPEDRPTRITVATGNALAGRVLGIKRADGSVTWLSVNTGFLRRPGEAEHYGVVSTLGDITAQRQAEAALRDSEARLRSLNELSSDWFWEQDTQLRFTRLEGRHATGERRELQSDLGKTAKQIGIEIEGGWVAHDALLQAHRPFRDALMWRTYPDGQQRCMSTSGEPMFDSESRFLGYRGVAVDITERKRAEQLRALEHAVNRSLNEADSVQEALKRVLGHICETQGWECGRYLRVDAPAGLLRFGEAWSVPGANIERYIEASRTMVYGRGVGVVGRVWQSGEPLWVADIGQDARVARAVLARETGMHGAFAVPVASEGETIGVLIFHSREIREPDEQLLQAIGVIGSQLGQFLQRKNSQQAALRLARMFAALSETNDAILHAESPDDLYQRVCDAAVHGGRFINTSIFLIDPSTHQAKPVAGAGRAVHQLREANISFDENLAQGQGLVGLAFRNRQTGVSNDFLHDARTGPWHAIARQCGCRAAAALPLVQGNRSIGAVLIYDDELNAFDDEIVRLLERMAENVAFALDNFEREAERRRAAQRIEYLANHDSLTGLPNLVLFSNVLELAIQSARRFERSFAVLFIDLDRFKIINDTLGHAAGDTLLQEMARRIKESLRASDFVARLGGDEFVVLAQELSEPEQVSIVASKLLSTLMQPVTILGQECRVTASIGISMFPADAKDEQGLMKNADVAMYVAKEAGKNNFHFYSKEMKTQSLERLTLEASLRQALERDEFFLHYQAKLELSSGAIAGVEALLRWRHPERGLISPAQFIPLAEETGLIVPIGKWVLQTACAQNVAWQRAGLAPVCMAVNLSPRQFADENWTHDLAAALQESGMAPELLELEITESMVMGNVDRAAKQLSAIKAMGVRLAIDDFGTGYSSLAQIKRFPIDTLKIDRSFISAIPHDAEDMAITKAIIAMGKTLGLTVVAEGVETLLQETFLRDHGCDQTQGYYFSRPVSPDRFAALLRCSSNRHPEAAPHDCAV
ncbi:MAG: EAL domain-containing protein [Burkholderiaceae bacterium]